MKKPPLLRRVSLFLTVFFFSIAKLPAGPQDQVLLQGFYWIPKTQLHSGWGNYVAELAPRIKELKIDSVWLPPNLKSALMTPEQWEKWGLTGYSVFDHYDLGDKYQNGRTRTPYGLKDEVLRTIAVLHANGVKGIQDIVLNHCIHSVDGDFDLTEPFVVDPEADNPGDPFYDGGSGGRKNFRYVSHLTPVGNWDDPVQDYQKRFGRWPKNAAHFYPNIKYPNNPDAYGAAFGPDLSWENTMFGNFTQGVDLNTYTSQGGSTGESSNAYDWNWDKNNVNVENYTWDSGKAWMHWYAKQVGFDGVRLDAVKHYPWEVSKYFVKELRDNLQWKDGENASKGESMFAVGEFVATDKGELDYYESYDNGNYNLGGQLGTFDFSLRIALKNMVDGQGGFDVGSIPAAQQDNRWRTVPFVNNHDTFRPILDSKGNYTGQWENGNELGGGHIHPDDYRIPAAYAVIFAVDGSPQVFFDDLFQVGSGNVRYTADPQDANQLKVRDYLANLIWCHQHLRFNEGAYKVRYQAQDHLVIERSARAIIGVNDNGFSDQVSMVQTDFAPGTQLKDYSGGVAGTRTVDNQGKVEIQTAKCEWGYENPNSSKRGYSVWAPASAQNDPPYQLTAMRTTQEWEMSSDLGDSHPLSLRQSGHLPPYTSMRTVGNIYPQPGTKVNYWVTPEGLGNGIVKIVFKNNATQLHSKEGKSKYSGSFTVPNNVKGYVTMYLAHIPDPGAPMKNMKWQRAWVRADYLAPAVVNVKKNEDRHPQAWLPDWPEASPNP